MHSGGFRSFRPDAVAAFTDEDIEHLVSNPAIIRNCRKIEAAITNAWATPLCGVDETPDTHRALAWSWPSLMPTHPTCVPRFPQFRPNRVPWLSLSPDLKARGFRFVGPTTMLAHGRTGIANTDITPCPASRRHRPPPQPGRGRRPTHAAHIKVILPQIIGEILLVLRSRCRFVFTSWKTRYWALPTI